MPNQEITIRMVIEAEGQADTERLTEFAVAQVTSAVRKSKGGTVAAVVSSRDGNLNLTIKSGALSEEMQTAVDGYANEAPA